MREADDDLHIAVKTSPLWRVKDDLLQSVPGVGRVVSLTLLAELSEPGRLSSKEIAALVGVVPLAREQRHASGQAPHAKAARPPQRHGAQWHSVGPRAHAGEDLIFETVG
jgi:transposase